MTLLIIEKSNVFNVNLQIYLKPGVGEIDLIRERMP